MQTLRSVPHRTFFLLLLDPLVEPHARACGVGRWTVLGRGVQFPVWKLTETLSFWKVCAAIGICLESDGVLAVRASGDGFPA